MNQFNKLLLNYKTNTINKCCIYFGETEINNKNIVIFNKTLINHSHFLNIISSLNYKNKSYDTKIINYNNHYLNKYKNIHTKNTNINHNIIDNKLIITYLETIIPNNDFSCKKKYNTLNLSIIEFIINDEISIIFSDNTIKIELIINHNIDNTLKILPKILSNFD